MRKKAKSLLDMLKKLPPINRATVNLLVALVVVGGIIGGVYIYEENFTEHAATICGQRMTPCPLPKTCSGTIYTINGVRTCSNSCCFNPTTSPTITGTITPTTTCSIGPDPNLNTAVSNTVATAQTATVPTTTFSTAFNQTITNIRNTQSFQLANNVDYDTYEAYLNSTLQMPPDVARRIVTNTLKYNLKASASPLFDYGNQKLNAIQQKLSSFIYSKKPNLNPTTPKNANTSQDSGAGSVSISVPVRFNGATVGGSLRATFQLQQSKYSQLNMYASYNMCRLSSIFQGDLEGTIGWGVSYSLVRPNGTMLAPAQSINFTYTKADDTRLGLNFGKSF